MICIFSTTVETQFHYQTCMICIWNCF